VRALPIKIIPGMVLAVCLALVPGPALAHGDEDEAGYYGDDEECLTCHDDVEEHFEQTVHAKVFRSGVARTSLMLRGCEACHGPAAIHVESEGETLGEGLLHLRPDGTEDPALQVAACLSCHDDSERRYWQGGAHDATEVSCTECHSVMKKVSRENLLSAETEMETCGRCHPVARSQLYRNAHMPVREGKMSCGSCHNSHGTVADNLIADQTVNDLCYRCHAEKRGPFLWDHPPVYEDCLNCHHPHGSTRRAMLKLSQPRLCQQCHPTGHPGGARAPDDRRVVGRSCLQCHEAVHGSNHPSAMGLTR
jgi:DmsE family decaheme c-type cytochrome